LKTLRFHGKSFGYCLAYKHHENPPCQTWFAMHGKNSGALPKDILLAIQLWLKRAGDAAPNSWWELRSAIYAVWAAIVRPRTLTATGRGILNF
jgi:hypothetical protein